MKLGTIVYENEIYNLDYMNASEIKQIINTAEESKIQNINEGKQTINKPF